MEKQYSGELVHEVCDDNKNVTTELAFTDGGTQLENMPVECLIDIFSVRSLGLMDLCSIAETCKLFRDITQRVIGKISSLYEQDGDYVYKSMKYFLNPCKRNDIGRIFRNFGSCLSQVLIGSEDVRRDCFVLHLVKRHCGEGLKHLDICNREISATLAEDLKPIFRRLQTFKLFGVSIEGNSSPFRDLDSLVELQVYDVENCSSILENTFPKLEKFSYEKCSESDDHNDDLCLEKLSTFITRHTLLKSLGISLTCDRCDEHDWTIILRAIGNNCTELLELSIQYDNEGFRSPTSLIPWQSLNSLRIVDLCSVWLYDFKAFAFLTGLRELRLHSCFLPGNVDEFAYLAQLTEVSMTDCTTMGASTYAVTNIIRHLVNLVKLTLLGFFHNVEFALNQATLREIVDIYEERPNILELECLCDATVRKRLRSQKVELIHR